MCFVEPACKGACPAAPLAPAAAMPSPMAFHVAALQADTTKPQRATPTTRAIQRRVVPLKRRTSCAEVSERVNDNSRSTTTLLYRAADRPSTHQTRSDLASVVP